MQSALYKTPAFKIGKEMRETEALGEVMVRVAGGIIGDNDLGESSEVWYRKER